MMTDWPTLLIVVIEGIMLFGLGVFVGIRRTRKKQVKGVT